MVRTKEKNLRIPRLNFSVSAHAFSQLYKMTTKKIHGVLQIGNEEYEVEVRLRGSSTKNNPKRSYEVNFISNLYRGQKTIHLNAEFWDYSLLRNKLSFDFFKYLEVLTPAAQHIVLYINDDFQGVYTCLESLDEHYLTRNNLPLGSIHYAVDSNANFNLMKKYEKGLKSDLIMGYISKKEHGDGDNKLREFISKINSLPDNSIYSITEDLDIDNFIGWMLGAVLTSNYDGFNKNYALYFNPEAAKFFISPWDYDGTWGRNWCGKILKYDRVPIYGHNNLTIKLYKSIRFRKKYFEKMTQTFEEYFNVDNIKSRLNYLYDVIRDGVYEDIYKRSTNNEFEEEYDLILKYVRKRKKFLHEKIRNFG
jgi:spore coat protein H